MFCLARLAETVSRGALCKPVGETVSTSRSVQQHRTQVLYQPERVFGNFRFLNSIKLRFRTLKTGALSSKLHSAIDSSGRFVTVFVMSALKWTVLGRWKELRELSELCVIAMNPQNVQRQRAWSPPPRKCAYIEVNFSFAGMVGFYK